MKKWQEERNYRRVRSEGGEVIANIITVDGMDVEVPEDVYLAYAQADRRERYITEEQSSGKLLSLDCSGYGWKKQTSGADGGRCAFAGLCRSRNGPQRRN